MNYQGPSNPVLIVGAKCYTLPGPRGVVVYDAATPAGVRFIVANPGGSPDERAAAALVGEVTPATQ